MERSEYAAWRAFVALDRFARAPDEQSRSRACRWALAWGRAARAARQALESRGGPCPDLSRPDALFLAKPVQGSSRSSNHQR